ncbi:MAG: 6-phosphogluconolactonase [Acidobacteria bacterium]|nr:6-phosphogluconolactonase [Acidobacteriota bacterium]
MPGGNPSPLPREIQPGVLVCSDEIGVARAAARQFVEWAWQRIARDAMFNVALAGGNTPQEFYRVLATSEFRTQVDWGKVQLFWGDERAVPPVHPDSNYGMARRELLVRIPIPPGNVHRMEAEQPVIGRAAEDYEEVIRRLLPLNLSGFPRFHLMLLGIGKDGHTASLFPGARRLRHTSRWVSTPQAPQLGTRRMTLTLPVLNAAYQVLFLVTGADKAEALQAVLEGKNDPPLPAQLVTVPDGRRMFLVDEAAARLLAREVATRAFRSAPTGGAPQGPGSGQSREGQ